jgi:hypothetical protein
MVSPSALVLRELLVARSGLISRHDGEVRAPVVSTVDETPADVWKYTAPHELISANGQWIVASALTPGHERSVRVVASTVPSR